MKQFMDIFSLPEMTLLSCVNDYFMMHNIDYEPVHLYKDVKVRAKDIKSYCILVYANTLFTWTHYTSLLLITFQ